MALFKELTAKSHTPAGEGYLYGQLFDVSNNQLTGDLPTFLVSSNVPPWTQPGIRLQVS